MKSTVCAFSNKIGCYYPICYRRGLRAHRWSLWPPCRPSGGTGGHRFAAWYSDWNAQGACWSLRRPHQHRWAGYVCMPCCTDRRISWGQLQRDVEAILPFETR